MVLIINIEHNYELVLNMGAGVVLSKLKPTINLQLSL